VDEAGDRIMSWLSQVAPNIVANIAAAQAEQEAHQAECTADPCERCGRWPKPAQDLIPDDGWARMAFESIPAAYDAAALDADWLIALVGHPNIERAKISTGARRVVFVGPPGAGKTTLAVAMFRAAVEAVRPALPEGRRYWMGRPAEHRYVSSHQLAKARALHPLGEGEPPLIVEATRCPLLLIDELGGEDQRHASAVAEVIYDRHAEGLPTWITMGVGPKEVAARYGGGIARRVFEGATVFKLARKV
jgi:hypothetical protein